MVELFGMDINILEILQYVVMLVLGGLSLWFKKSEIAQKKVKEISEYTSDILGHVFAFITEAEIAFESGTGKEKKQYVVDKLYELLPSGIDKIITKEMIGEIVQATFDEVQEFVKLTLDKAVDKIELEKTDIEENN